MFSKIVELYADGYELVEIAEECGLSSEKEVIEGIISFKEQCKIPRGSKFNFNKTFKEIIADRFQSGVSLYSISKEMAVSLSTIYKHLNQMGIDTNKTYDKTYEVVENWDDFECCPTCNGTRNVRLLGVHNHDDLQERRCHSFCSTCNTEWYREVIGTFQGEPVYETRKVVWHTIK